MTSEKRSVSTKIIATLGPATATYEMLRALYDAGADCFRLNFSHGTHADHKKSVEAIHRLQADIQKETGREAQIGIIADLQGPKLRIGSFEHEKIALKPGMQIKFDQDTAPGNETRVCFPHPEILKALEPGAKFLMDDGNVGMHIVAHGDGYVVAEVDYGTSLASKKGVNVPDLSLPVETLTGKDRHDLEFALGLGVDYIAQSFIQSAEDVEEAKALIKGRAGLIAKIEKPAAVANISHILEVADVIMIARGDMSVEIPFAQVPGVQQSLIEKSAAAGRPVIVATQMLESMRESPRPTNAETGDVYRAVIGGASAVMLSAETSMGKYPLKAVQAMDEICYEAEEGALNSRKTLKLVKTGQVIIPFEPRFHKGGSNTNSYHHDTKLKK